MIDATKVLEAIFKCFNRSFTSSVESDSELVKTIWTGSWECEDDSCLAHNLFGLKAYELMICLFHGI